MEDIKKMLPKDVQLKQGTRVMQKTGKLTDLLKEHASSVEDIRDMEQVAQEADQAQNYGVLQYMQAQIAQKKSGLKDLVQKIRVRVKGRLVRSNLAFETLYEITDYNANTGQIMLRLMFDPNGILIAKNNTNGRVRRNIAGRWLDKHYFILPQAEEYEVRQRILSGQECKLIVKYQVINSGGSSPALGS